jgi:nucleoside-diphosphate-sugar epimerase
MMIQGILQGRYLNIAGGQARKSMLMVEDIAHIIPLAENIGGVYNLCADDHPSFKALSEQISRQLNKKAPLNIPYWVAWCLAVVGDVIGKKAPFSSYRLRKMTQSLTFCNRKAKESLGWNPIEVLTHFRIQ